MILLRNRLGGRASMPLKIIAAPEVGVGWAAVDVSEAMDLIVEVQDSIDLATRIKRGVDESDASIWIGPTKVSGWLTLRDSCRASGKPWCIVDLKAVDPVDVAEFLKEHGVETIHVLGAREFAAPGIGAEAAKFLARLFELAACW